MVSLINNRRMTMLKKNVLVSIMAALALVWVINGTAQAQEKKKDTKLTGEIIDAACYMKMGAKGADHKKCAEECAKGGGTLSFLEDGTGNVYLLAAGEGKDANAVVKEFVAEKVTITGTVYERGGARMVTVMKVEKVK
jgi:hypothetical protein